jgi:uncharacterized protein (DUF1015 family)
MTKEITDINLTISEIEKLIVTDNLTLEQACKKIGCTTLEIWNYLRTLDNVTFASVFSRAREVRGLKILDDCHESFKQMKISDDSKEQWKYKNVIDTGMRLAAVYNRNLSDKNSVNIQNNTINVHDDFVLKKIKD